MLTNSPTKTKLDDPFILSLVRNIGEKRSLLDNLESIEVNPEFSNIVSDKKGRIFYIENEFHKARGFRKLHVEIAEFSNNLKILHCVFFPDPLFNIPIFGLDLVKVNDIISAAIVDLSPISKEINVDLNNYLKQVNKKVLTYKRTLPSWGNIFSEYVFFASLKNNAEKQDFYNIVDKYLLILIDLTKRTLPDSDSKLIHERIHYQKRYCIQQMKNEKTSSVLQKYFDKEWVERYLKEILFDF